MKLFTFSLLVALVGFSSCNIQKRLYRDGFYVGRNGTVEHTVAHAESSALHKNNKKLSPTAEQLILQEEAVQDIPVINHADTPVISSPVVLIPQQEARDTLRNQRKQKSNKGSSGKLTPKKAGWALLIGLGAALTAALLALSTGFRYDTMLQALGMILAVIFAAIAMIFLYYGAIAFVILGIRWLIQRHREKQQQKTTT